MLAARRPLPRREAHPKEAHRVDMFPCAALRLRAQRLPAEAAEGKYFGLCRSLENLPRRNCLISRPEALSFNKEMKDVLRKAGNSQVTETYIRPLLLRPPHRTPGGYRAMARNLVSTCS